MITTFSHKFERQTKTPDGGVVISVETFDFKIIGGGHLHCLECDTKIWCVHIAELISVDGDKYQFFDFDSENRNPGDGHFVIQCPVFPTLNVFHEVTLIPRPELHAREVCHSTGNTIALSTLGYIHPGEGRAVIRSLIFDWFTAEFATVRFTCNSASHKPAQEARLQEMMRKPNSFLMARYVIWSSGNCPPCIKSTSDDFDDLIPDKENSNVWNK